jgi:hypothetical protein
MQVLELTFFGAETAAIGIRLSALGNATEPAQVGAGAAAVFAAASLQAACSIVGLGVRRSATSDPPATAAGSVFADRNSRSPHNLRV